MAEQVFGCGLSLQLIQRILSFLPSDPYIERNFHQNPADLIANDGSFPLEAESCSVKAASRTCRL